MWCPIDYHHVHEVIDAIELAATFIPPMAPSTSPTHATDTAAKACLENNDECHHSVVAGKLLQLFLDEYGANACASSASGLIFRLSRHVVRPIAFNHWMEFEYPFSRGIEFAYIDQRTGKIDPYGTAKRIRIWAGESGDFSHAETWQADAFRCFGELEGWCVCFPRDEIDLSTDALIKLWHRRFSEDLAKPIGRPRERENVAAAYKNAFPNGHGYLTQKQILQKLASLGIHTSVDTLRRALKQSG